MVSNYTNYDEQYKSETSEVFVGINIEYVDGAATYNRIGVNATSMVGLFNEVEYSYESKAIMSIDGLIRPFSMDGDGGLPRYVQYIEPSGCEDLISYITLDDLNPLTNPSGLNRSHVSRTRSDTSNIGHDFDILGRDSPTSVDGDTFPEGGLVMPAAGSLSQHDFLADYKDDYRPLALRGPLIVGGWGYHPNGSPIPNKNDVEANTKDGNFIGDPASLNSDKFLDGHLYKSSTWAIAPVDLRLNVECGTWQAFACNGIDRLIPARLNENMAAGETKMATESYGGTTISVVNNTNTDYLKDACIIVKRNYGCNFEILYGDCNPSGETIPSGLIKFCQSDFCITESTFDCEKDDWETLNFGRGLAASQNGGNPAQLDVGLALRVSNIGQPVPYQVSDILFSSNVGLSFSTLEVSGACALTITVPGIAINTDDVCISAGETLNCAPADKITFARGLAVNTHVPSGMVLPSGEKWYGVGLGMPIYIGDPDPSGSFPPGFEGNAAGLRFINASNINIDSECIAEVRIDISGTSQICNSDECVINDDLIDCADFNKLVIGKGISLSAFTPSGEVLAEDKAYIIGGGIELSSGEAPSGVAGTVSALRFKTGNCLTVSSSATDCEGEVTIALSGLGPSGTNRSIRVVTDITCDHVADGRVELSAHYGLIKFNDCGFLTSAASDGSSVICCVSAPPCPTDCFGCGNTATVTFGGFTGICTWWNDNDLELSQVGTTCVWNRLDGRYNGDEYLTDCICTVDPSGGGDCVNGITPSGQCLCVDAIGCDGCLEDCYQGLDATDNPRISCVDGVWTLVANLGTVGACPNIKVEITATAPINCEDPTCPPDGAWTVESVTDSSTTCSDFECDFSSLTVNVVFA